MATEGKRHFCVIGAGASGMPTIKSSLEIGADVTCFEASEDIGGIWRYTEEVTPKGSVAKSTVINTSKETMSYSDFPFPAEYPVFMRHEFLFQYFKKFTDHFGLRKYIRFNTEVLKVDFASDYAATGRWDVTHRDKVTGKETTTTFDGVFVCTGHYAQPYLPKLKGLDSFKGKIIHTHDYKRPDEFADKTICVVGIGNSGGDVAVELCRLAKRLHLSTRRGTWVYPRVLPNGSPRDTTMSRWKIELFKYVPTWVPDWYARNCVIQADHDLIGLKPSHQPSAQTFFISDDLPNRILSGLVKVQPDVKCFGPKSVTFVDGTVVEDLDVVVLATGYIFGFPFVPSSVVKVEENKIDLYKMIFPPDLKHPTLAIIGCVAPMVPLFPVLEIQGRWAVRVVSGMQKLPSRDSQWEWIRERYRQQAETFVATLRHTIQVDGYPYIDDIAQEVGCAPSLAKILLWGDVKLAYSYLTGLVVPYQYRLFGPNAWPGARDAIVTANERHLEPIKSNIGKLYSTTAGQHGNGKNKSE